MDLNLGIDLINKRLLNQDGTVLTIPPLVQGDILNVVLQGITVNPNGSVNLVPIPFNSIKLGIGPIDAAPLAGHYRLSVGGDATVDLAWNSSKQFVEQQLNQLASVQQNGGVTVLPDGSVNYHIIAWKRPNVTLPVTITSVDLFPECFTRSVPWKTNSNTTVQVVRFFQAPSAFTDNFALPTAAPVQVVEVRVGTATRNEYQRVSVPANSQGEFSLTWRGLTTAVIPVSTVSATLISDALNNLFSDGVTRFSVTQPGKNYFYVEFVGPLALQSHPLMSVTMESQPPLETPTATLDLGGPGFALALNGGMSTKMRLEIEINDGQPGTPIQSDVTILAAMIDSQMALYRPPWWLDNATEIPADSGQTLIGARGYLAPEVGDGVALNFTITHNLGTLSPIIQLIDNTSNIVLPDTMYTATVVNMNAVRVSFPEAPLWGEYRLVATSPQNTPYRENLIINIGDVIGLQEALNGLSAQGNPLDLWPLIPVSKLPKIPFSKMDGRMPDSLLPADAAILDANKFLPLANLPPEVLRMAPDGSVVYRSSTLNGTNAVWTTLLTPGGQISSNALGDLASVPVFVQAVQQVLAGLDVAPQGLVIPLYPKTELIGYEGGTVAVGKTGWDPSKLPTRAMPIVPSLCDRELFQVAVNEAMLSQGRTFDLDFGVALQALLSNCSLEWSLVVELGTFSDQNTLLNVSWSNTPVFTQKILLTEERTVHSFGLSVVRQASGFSLEQKVYGNKTRNDSAGPSSSNFAVRARLTALKTQPTSNPRGWISYALVASSMGGSSLTQPQAHIY